MDLQKSLFPVLLSESCLLLASVALFLAWSMSLRCRACFHQLTFAMAHSEMPLFNLETYPGKWIVLACCLHEMKSLLGTTSFQYEKTYSRNKIHSYFCLIMHRININCLPKEKMVNICFHLSWRYNRL